jgi:hypothetical protein
MIIRFSFLTQILFFFTAFCYGNPKKAFTDLSLIINDKHSSCEFQTDSLELFFHSKGVITFNPTDVNLKKGIEILNDDNTVYATIKLSFDKIIIQGKQFPMDAFSNNNKLRNKYHFFPKEFFPDQSIIQFEFISIKNGFAEIYIDKVQGKRKKIKLNRSLFKVESWKEHLIGCMIDFNKRDNPIRKKMDVNSESLEYEDSKEEYIFVVSGIEGDWIKIECSDICEYPCDSGKKYDGWIKWKKGNQLLINLLYSC